MRKLLEITTGRHPFQVATVAACPVAAVAVLVSGRHPASLDAALPGALGYVWLVALAAGGITTIVGAYWRGDLDTGLIVEGGGISLMASMLSIYVAALFLVNGAGAAAAGGFLASIAVAGWWRIRQIARDVRKVWRAQREGLTPGAKTLPHDPPPRPGAA